MSSGHDYGYCFPFCVDQDSICVCINTYVACGYALLARDLQRKLALPPLLAADVRGTDAVPNNTRSARELGAALHVNEAAAEAVLKRVQVRVCVMGACACPGCRSGIDSVACHICIVTAWLSLVSHVLDFLHGWTDMPCCGPSDPLA